MSLAAVQSEILEPMQALFLPPRDMDAAAQTTALKGYGAVLERFEAPDLRMAWGEVVCEHRTRAWPVPGVIVTAARKAQKDRTGADAPARTIGGMDWAARRRLWQYICVTQLAADAAEAGVAWSLKCAVLNDGKQAHEIALAELIRGRRNAERTAHAIGDGLTVLHRGRRLTFSESNRELVIYFFRYHLPALNRVVGCWSKKRAGQPSKVSRSVSVSERNLIVHLTYSDLKFRFGLRGWA